MLVGMRNEADQKRDDIVISASAHHVGKVISYTLLFKGVLGCGFTALTLCGIALPWLGFDFTPACQLGAGVLGGLLGQRLP